MVTKERIIEALKCCKDPEVQLNIVDLGLIEKLKIEDDQVFLEMILASPTCPLQAYIVGEAHSCIMEMEGVSNVQVEVLPEPKWTPSRLSPEGREALGI
ncbi:MAG: metal-sulfur cluster assembly factor [Thermoplasmata archaeon]|nr:metal-sulfur cluster assembly factor [Thermoplasmata archaeon]